jgi:hypothetical protein
LNFLEDISVGGGVSMKVGPDFLELFKKWSKIKVKTNKFFNWK